MIGATLPQPAITESVSLDSFGNIAEISWWQGGTVNSDNTVSGGAAAVDVAYGYDQVGDILWRDDLAADTAGVSNLEQTYSYDAMNRLTGYSQGAFNSGTHTISGSPAASWSLDSQGNRYSASGTFATTYGTNGQSTSQGYQSGDTTKVNFGNNETTAVSYDAWGRVVQTVSTVDTGSITLGIGGPNGHATSTTYSYDALGRQIATASVQYGNLSVTGTQTYYDGNNPVQVRLSDNATQLMQYVWSPADGRMILRDAAASQLGSYTGLTISGNYGGGSTQRLYSLTDGQGSIIAVADYTGVVQERYVYTADGYPQALQANWQVYSSGTYASQLGWNWFYKGQQWVQTQPDATYTDDDNLNRQTFQSRGLYVTPSGPWYDPVHATVLQPNLSAYGYPQTNPYQLSTYEQIAAIALPILVGIEATLVTVATCGAALPLTGGALAVATTGVLAGAAGGAATLGTSSYLAGGSAAQVAKSTLIGGVAGGVGGLAGGLAGLAARSVLVEAGITCEAGYGTLAGITIGAAEGAAFGATEGFVRQGLLTGDLDEALLGGLQGGLMGGFMGGAMGAIFHQACFRAGTLVATSRGLVPIEEIVIGDEVWAYDFVTGKWRLCCVLQTFIHDLDDQSAVIIVEGEMIESTSGHPFWVVRGEDLAARRCAQHIAPPAGTTTPGRWVEASDVRAGDELLLRDGRIVPVQSVRSEPFKGKVYNFSVAELESYAVGRNNVLVHNTGCAGGGDAEAGAHGELATGEVPFGTPFDPDAHNLVTKVYRDGDIISQRQFVSGDITSEEAALAEAQGLAEPWRIGDTENRAIRAIELQPGDQLVFEGQFKPCLTCQAAMIDASAVSGAEIQYRYLDGAGNTRVFSGQQGGFIYAEF